MFLEPGTKSIMRDGASHVHFFDLTTGEKTAPQFSTGSEERKTFSIPSDVSPGIVALYQKPQQNGSLFS
jgi:hypothetical protein